jgi:hypothetical protein
MEAKKLQKRTILKILKQCRENDRLNSLVWSYYLCNELKFRIAKHLKLGFNDLERDDVDIYIPLFNYSNAVKHANADPSIDGKVPFIWWGSQFNTTYECNMNRAKFLDWLIEQYSKK